MKGSRQIVEALKAYIAEYGLADKVSLSGTFCMKNCRLGVSVTVDGKLCSVTPETVEEFFKTEILNNLI